MSSIDQGIRFENVTKSFDGQTVLDRVSFGVPRGKACCILGRSGTGKSVTLKLANQSANVSLPASSISTLSWS